jgi:ATP citrate (pro-S)-lyase
LETSKAAFDHEVERIFLQAEKDHPWLLKSKLVCKPDQLIKRRGKNGLLGINLDWKGVKEWVAKRAGTIIKIERTHGYLDNFLVEEFCPHSNNSEFYICIQSVRQGDLIYFTHEGGVDVGDVDEKAAKLMIEVNEPFPTAATIKDKLLKGNRYLILEVKSEAKVSVLVKFIISLHQVYSKLNFTYLEINPLVVLETPNGINVYYLDLAAKLDQTAEFECAQDWAKALRLAYPDVTSHAGPCVTFPAPFGRQMTKEESYIAELDSKTGASLKLTVLNPKGRIWTMVIEYLKLGCWWWCFCCLCRRNRCSWIHKRACELR